MTFNNGCEPGPASTPPEQSYRKRLPAELAISLPPDLAQALKHSLRRRILRALQERAAPASPVQLAEDPLAGEKVGAISYHLQVLERYGLAKLRDTRQVRGVVEHFYVADFGARPLVGAALDQTAALDAAEARISR
jgi:DNA-binding transcriptional ArsR family regulator